MKLHLNIHKVIEHPSGFELAFNTKAKTIEWITSQGDTRTERGSLADDIVGCRELEYWFFEEGQSMLIASVEGQRLYRFFYNQSKFEIAAELHRTDLVEEGFDYFYFHSGEEQNGSVFLCYEQGLMRFDESSSLVWSVEFEGTRVFPEFSAQEVRYNENDKCWRYSLVDGMPLD